MTWNLPVKLAPVTGAACDIADAIMFLICLPRRANVSQMLIRLTDDRPAGCLNCRITS